MVVSVLPINGRSGYLGYCYLYLCVRNVHTFKNTTFKLKQTTSGKWTEKKKQSRAESEVEWTNSLENTT